jgi:hypothetical protein
MKLMLTVIAWIFLVVLLWALCDLLWDYFSYPVFEFSRTHSLNWQAFVDRIAGLALLTKSLAGSVADLLGICAVQRTAPHARSETRAPSSAEASTPPFLGLAPETIEPWRKSQVVVVQFDTTNRLAKVTAKTPAPL